MTNLWQPIRTLAIAAVFILLCAAYVPVACASTNGSASTQTATSANTQVSTATAAEQNNQTATRPKTKTVAKPREQSVLDAELLDSPISYLREAFSDEEDNTGMPLESGTVVMTVKALIATLISTIL